MDKQKQIIIFGLSYVGWFACVLAGKYSLGAWAFLAPVVFIATLSRFMQIRPKHALAFAIIALIGICFDSIALSLGWITLAAPIAVSEVMPAVDTSSAFASVRFAPAWLIALWILFGCTVPLYDGWMKGRLWLAAGLGVIIGPLSYRSGAAFDTLLFPDKTVFIYYGLFWACFFPLSLFIYERSANDRRPQA